MYSSTTDVRRPPLSQSDASIAMGFTGVAIGQQHELVEAESATYSSPRRGRMAKSKSSPRKRGANIPLLDRILLDEAENPSPPRPMTKQDVWTSQAQTRRTTSGTYKPDKLLPLRDWAVSIFGDAKPCDNTLRIWAASGKIIPAPQKIGRALFCQATATYYGAGTVAERVAFAKQPTSTAPSAIGLPRLIPLTTWAELTFGEHAPHRNTVLNWVRDGKIVPRPVRVGRRYFCKPDAEYVDAMTRAVNRLLGR
jgi:hypothetical protein